MRCYSHPTDEALGICRHCGRGLCAKCANDVKGVLACTGCRSEAASIVQSAHLVGWLSRGFGVVLMGVLVYAGVVTILGSLFATPEWNAARITVMSGGALLLISGFLLYRKVRGASRPTPTLP